MHINNDSNTYILIFIWRRRIFLAFHNTRMSFCIYNETISPDDRRSLILYYNNNDLIGLLETRNEPHLFFLPFSSTFLYLKPSPLVYFLRRSLIIHLVNLDAVFNNSCLLLPFSLVYFFPPALTFNDIFSYCADTEKAQRALPTSRERQLTGLDCNILRGNNLIIVDSKEKQLSIIRDLRKNGKTQKVYLLRRINGSVSSPKHHMAYSNHHYFSTENSVLHDDSKKVCICAPWILDTWITSDVLWIWYDHLIPVNKLHRSTTSYCCRICKPHTFRRNLSATTATPPYATCKDMHFLGHFFDPQIKNTRR